MIAQFQKLGATVADLWSKAGLTESSFAEIATTALSNSRVLTTIEPHEIVAWLMTGDHIPHQNASDFGQPPINVYVGEGFYIQVLFWLDSTTAIHEHSFSGAFGVLSGSSVQSTYSFETYWKPSDRLIVGSTKFLSAELLHRGDVRAIHSGDRLIHSLFHLDRPSLSLVVRTSTRPSEVRPQYNYLRPYLAFDDMNPPPLETIRLRMLESLFQFDARSFWESAGQIVATCEPYMLSNVLEIAYRGSADEESWTNLLSCIGEQTKGLVQYILPSLTESSRINRLVALRSLVHDATHRFFLALLLNVPARKEVYELIAARYPLDDPQSLSLRWLGEIFSEERAGVQLTSPLIFIIEQILRDPSFEHSRIELKRYFGSDDSEINKLQNVWLRLQSLDVLKPLFTSDLPQTQSVRSFEYGTESLVSS